MKTFQRLIASVLIVGMSLSGLTTVAQASLVSTEQVLAATATPGPMGANAERERVAAFLARGDVQSALQAQGVSPQAAAQRAQALSDAEVQHLATRMDQLPAGGDVVGVMFTVFIVLLVTDILGFTKVFPFTRSIR